MAVTTKSRKATKTKKNKSKAGRKPLDDPKDLIRIWIKRSTINKLGGEASTKATLEDLAERLITSMSDWIAAEEVPVKIDKYEVVLSDGQVEIASINAIGQWTITNGKEYGDLSIGSTGKARRVLFYRPRPLPPANVQYDEV